MNSSTSLIKDLRVFPMRSLCFILMARLLTRVNVSIMDRSVLNGEGSVLEPDSGIEPSVIHRLFAREREHLVSRTLSAYVTSVSFRAATSVAINHAARAMADTVRRLACLMTDQSARARTHVSRTCDKERAETSGGGRRASRRLCSRIHAPVRSAACVFVYIQSDQNR